MIPEIPFDEMGLVIATMSTGMTAVYFIVVAILNLLGLYIQDMQIDKEKARVVSENLRNSVANGTQPPNLGEKTYELEWRELAPYALVSAIFTMAIFEIYQVQFWMAMVLAVIMGMAFRVILVEIGKAIPEVVTAVVDRVKASIETILLGKK